MKGTTNAPSIDARLINVTASTPNPQAERKAKIENNASSYQLSTRASRKGMGRNKGEEEI